MANKDETAVAKIPRIPGNRHGCDLLFNAMTPEFSKVLPRSIRPEVLIRCAITAIQQNPGLFECTSRSLAGALIQCAQLGLLPDSTLGHSYLVPYRNRKTGAREAQLQIGYKGLIYLAARSDAISHVDADVVYDGDYFDYAKGTDAFIKHKPAQGRGEKASKDVVYVYAIATLPNGRTKFDLMEREEIEKIRKAAPSSRSRGQTPWDTHWEEMAKKTVLRRLCKTIPNAPLTQAANLDEMAAAGLSQGLDATVVVDNAELDKALGEPDLDPTDAGDDDVPDPEPMPPEPQAKSGKKSGRRKARAKQSEAKDEKPKGRKPAAVKKSSLSRFERLLEIGKANGWEQPDVDEFLEDAEAGNLDAMTEEFYESLCTYVRDHSPEGSKV